MAGTSVLGLVVAALAAAIAHASEVSWAFTLAGLPAAFIGVALSVHRGEWWLSLIGHVLAAAGFGLLTEPVLTAGSTGWLRTSVAMQLSGLAAMAILAYALPAVARRVGTFLVGLAVGAMVVHMWSASLGLGQLGIPSLAVTAVVLGYIDYYWAQALRHVARSADNAVDTACAIYLDPVSRLLSALEARAKQQVSYR